MVHSQSPETLTHFLGRSFQRKGSTAFPAIFLSFNRHFLGDLPWTIAPNRQGASSNSQQAARFRRSMLAQ
jgi:hypothetical protein